MKLPAIALFSLSSMLIAVSSNAQSVIPGTGGPTVVAPTSTSGRTTENLSVTNGSRTTLSVGNSTTFGASANLTASEGLTALSRTVLVPDAVSINSTIGSGQIGGLTIIKISNLTAKGGGQINPGEESGAGAGSTIDSTDGQFASGNATIDGMGASVIMSIDRAKGGQAEFFSTVHPNILAGEIACAPNALDACPYEQNGLVSGNSGSNANLSTTTNIDIQANSFTNTFAQSF